MVTGGAILTISQLTNPNGFSNPANEFEVLYVEFQNEYIARIFADMLAASEQFKGEEIKVENK